VDAEHEVVAFEREIALDIVRRGVLVAPLIVLVLGLVRGWAGALGAAIALAVVCANFLASAWVIDRLSRLGPNALFAGVMVGWIVRMAVVVAVLLACRQSDAIDFPVLGFTIFGTHLGLLFWEAKHVSLTLGAPGLRPRRPVTSGDQ
jgi:ATP synthase protein I